MSSLGELFFTLGLDDKKFNDAIEAAKKKIKDLGADVEIGVKLDLDGIKKEIQNAVRAASGGNLEVGAKVKADGLENLRSMLEASKKEAKELEDAIANASAASVKVQKQSELESVRKRIANQEAQIKSKELSSGNTTSTPLKVTLDQDSVNIVQAQLTKLGEPITAKISVEYDLEKFQAVETAMKNFGSRINQAINAGLPQGSTPTLNKTGKQKGVAGWLDKVSTTLFGDSADGGGYSTPAASAANISQVSSALGTLSKEIEALGKATEKISKRARGKRSVVSDEEAEMRKYYSQLQRLEEGVRRWQNVKAKIESSKIDKNSDNYKQAIRLIDDYIAKLTEAQKQAGKFSNRELAGMLGQTASGEIAKTGRLVAQQKSDEQAIRNNLAREQAQIQRLEEGVRRVQNVIAKLNATDVDKSGAGYMQAIALLNDYIDKLNTAKKNAGNFTKREMAGMLGQTLGGEIAEAERLVAAQKKEEQSKKKTAKSVAQAEKEELQLKREKIKLQKEEANLGKARANQKKAELQKEKEAVRLRKEQVSLQKKLGKTVSGVGNWAAQLGNQLGNYISIYSIEQFVRNLYTIGGEFQKQQIALQNMLGDATKGNTAFERMKELAVKSPFTFSDLASYTKQMSAYGIEYENLYDTTKRLADISAGVGVDMGRLILAFGQVRSAAVLRGQELRQFTEAGIPLVNELAKKFSELEHRAVSAGEVFEKISKREVSFGMVKDILFDMTDPGGKFFQTQEQLAESLAGKWSNLKDAWDIMMADIANGNNTALKGLAETLTWIISHWEKFAPLVMGAVVALGAYRSIMTLLIPLQAAFFATTNLAPWVSIATILGGAAIAVAGYIDEAETALELSERLNTAAQKAESENTDKLNTASRYLDILKQQASVEEDKYALYQKQLKTFEELVKLYPKQMEGIEFEKLTLQEIENIRKRIAEQAKSDTLSSYDKNINDAFLAYTLERQRMAVKANAAGLTIDDYSEKEKKNLTDLYNIYTGLMNAKEEYEQSLLDKNKPVALENWQEVAKKMTDEYAKSKIYFKDPAAEHDIYAYFDHLEEVFKDAKSKYERATDESLRKPQRAIMNAANAINMAIGGRNLNYKEINKINKDVAKKEVQSYLEALKNEVARVTEKWNLYKELADATGNKALAMKIAFDGEVVSFENELEWLKHRIEEEAKKANLNINLTDLLGLGEKQLIERGVEEKVAKGVGHLIDTYNKANKKLSIDTVKQFAEIIKASRNFEEQIAAIDAKLQEDLAKLRIIYKDDDAGLKLAETELKRKAEEDKTKIRFEEFQKSSDWVKVFDDLDGVSNATLDNMIKNIERFARQTDLTQDEVKQLIEALRKLREKAVERNPFKAFKNSWEDLKELKNAVKGTSNGKTNYTVTFSDGTIKQYSEEEYNNALQKALGGLNQSALGVVNKFSAVGQAADMLAGLFGDSASALRVFADVINNTMNSAASGANIGSAFGGAGGLYGAIAGAAIGFVSAAFSAHDKNMQRIIELAETRKKISENISSNLEASLERMMGGVYTLKLDDNTKSYFGKVIESGNNYMQAVADLKNGFNGWMDTLTTLKEGTHYSEDTLNTILEALEEDSYYDAQLANLKIQRDEVMKQLSSEQSKGKDEDAAKVEDYKQEIEELNVAIEYFAQDMANTLYSIDFKDWAGQITDSIVEAWANGEDAAKAYEETVSDIMRNVAAKMAQQAIIEQYMNTFLKPFLDEFAAKNGVMDADMYSELANIVDGTGDRIEQVQLFLEELEKMMNEKGLSLMTEMSNSSSLSKGIQSVTEDTANLLGSYLNSIRQDVSVNRTLFEQLVSVSVPRMSMIAEAQLQQLQMVVANTKRNADAADRIYELVNKVVDKGGNKLRV